MRCLWSPAGLWRGRSALAGLLALLQRNRTVRGVRIGRQCHAVRCPSSHATCWQAADRACARTATPRGRFLESSAYRAHACVPTAGLSLSSIGEVSGAREAHEGGLFRGLLAYQSVFM